MNDKKHCRLKEGIMTGSKISVALAEMRVNFSETDLLNSTTSFKSYQRYIDYCSIVFKRSKSDKIKLTLNNAELQFNFE